MGLLSTLTICQQVLLYFRLSRRLSMAVLLVLVSVLNRKPRQSRKEATVVVDAGDVMWRIVLPIIDFEIE